MEARSVKEDRVTCIAAIVLLELHDERYDEEDKDDRTILANPATTDGFPALIPRRSRISFWSVSASGNRQLEILILIIEILIIIILILIIIILSTILLLIIIIVIKTI